jgi:hypothetical protein
MDQDTQKPDLPKIAKAWISFFLILIVIAAGVGFYAYRQSEGASRGAIVEKELPPLVSDLRGREGVIARSIQESYKEYRDDAKNWSGGYYGLLVFAAVLSALSGVALKLSHFIPSDGIRNDVAAILAATSAIVITVTTTVDSQRKWQANRIAASDTEQMAIEFVTADPIDRANSLQHYSQRLQEIALARQQEVVGTRAVTDKGKPGKASDTK